MAKTVEAMLSDSLLMQRHGASIRSVAVEEDERVVVRYRTASGDQVHDAGLVSEYGLTGHETAVVIACNVEERLATKGPRPA